MSEEGQGTSRAHNHITLCNTQRVARIFVRPTSEPLRRGQNWGWNGLLSVSYLSLLGRTFQYLFSGKKNHLNSKWAREARRRDKQQKLRVCVRKGVRCKPAVTRFCICQCLKDCTTLFCLSLSLCVSRGSLSLSLTLSFLGIITNEAISCPLSWTFLTMMPRSSGWERSLSSARSHSLLLLGRPRYFWGGAITPLLLGDPGSSSGDQEFGGLCPLPRPVDGECEKSLAFSVKAM